MENTKEVFGYLDATSTNNTLKYISDSSACIYEIIELINSNENITVEILKSIISKNNIDIDKNSIDRKNIIEDVKNIIINITESSRVINSYLTYKDSAVNDSLESKKLTVEKNKLEKNNTVTKKTVVVKNKSNTKETIKNTNDTFKTNNEIIKDSEEAGEDIKEINEINEIVETNNNVNKEILPKVKSTRAKKSSVNSTVYNFAALENGIRSKNKVAEILTFIINNNDLDKFIDIEEDENIEDLSNIESTLYNRFNNYLSSSIESKFLIMKDENNNRITNNINVLTGINIYYYNNDKVNATKLKELKGNAKIDYEDTYIYNLIHTIKNANVSTISTKSETSNTTKVSKTTKIVKDNKAPINKSSNNINLSSINDMNEETIDENKNVDLEDF